MVGINENNVNTMENRMEMTTKEENVTTEEDKKVLKDLSTKNNNNEESSTKNNNNEVSSTKNNNNENFSTKNDNSTTISITNDEKTTKRIIQIVGEGHSKRNNNNVAENSKINNDNSIIYEFDATTEDPFTLESFDTLIQQHSERDKDFIIARVTTADPSDDNKHYHSYYSGHQINKVLFRTQPDQGLLHRMKAKNPLNNMSIIGDVHYYVVKASSVKKLPAFTKSSSMSVSSKKTLKIGEGSTIMATSSLDKVEGKDFTKIDIDNIDDIRSSSNKLRSAPPSIWNFKCNDDDDEKFAIEMEPTSNNKRWSADGSLKLPPKAITANHNSSTSDSGENFERLLTKLQSFDKENNHQSSKIILPPSVNNEISISISHNDLKDQQIDSSIAIIQSPTKDSHSESINDENEVDDGTIYYKAKFYATDDDFLMHSTIRHFFKANALEPMDAQLFTINMNVSPNARLERMVSGHEAFLLDPMVVGNMRSPLITSNADSSELSTVPTSRWRRIVNNLRMNKGLRWLVLMYMIFGFLLIRFVVAETYAYLMAFLLMLCLFLVFCVGSGVGIWGR